MVEVISHQLQVYWSVQAVITKYHRLGVSNNRNLFSHASGELKSKIKVPSGLVSGEISLPGLQIAAFTLCPQMASPLWSCEEREISGVFASS